MVRPDTPLAAALSVLVLLSPALADSGASRRAGSSHDHAGSESSIPSTEAPARRPLPLEGTRYGHGVTELRTTPLGELLANSRAYEGQRVRVEGLVTEVCPKAGCWLNLREPGTSREVTFKVRDGVIVFPQEAKGQRAIAEGIVSRRELSLEATRSYKAHLAEELGREFDPASVTEPMTLVRVMGTGAVLQPTRKPARP